MRLRFRLGYHSLGGCIACRLVSSMALVLIRLGGSGLAIYNEHSVLFYPYLTHLDSESCSLFILFLVSLFFIEYSDQI